MNPKNIFYNKIEKGNFFSKKNPLKEKVPAQNCETHGKKLLKDLKEIFENSEEKLENEKGKYLEFIGIKNYPLKIESLKHDSYQVKVLKTEKIKKEEEFYEKALVFLPQKKENFFNKKIEKYIRTGGEKERGLIDSIEEIKRASIESFWIGEIYDIPSDNEEWCEFWIQKLKTDLVKKEIEKIKRLKIEVRDKFLEFEERNVILCKVNREKIRILIRNLDGISEIKLKSSFSLEEFFEKVDREEQYEWIEELQDRIKAPEKDFFSSSILFIDSGINNEHPLLKKYLKDENCRGYLENNLNDENGHGTKMAGLGLYQDLSKALSSREQIKIESDLQSYKIIYSEDEEKDLFGSMTNDAVLLSKDLHNQINCMAVTSDEEIKEGFPTAWSASIDKLCFGDEKRPEGRLFFIAAGNVNILNKSFEEEIGYPELNEISYVEDPGQTWNAITVGGYTTKYLEGKDIVAQPFSLSPFSKTSCLWNSKDASKLIKPEILFEAGNAIKDQYGCVECEELSLLTTNSKISDNYFNIFCETSAATALAANFCAKLVSKYPDAWPQTIRGLVVHSAEWTDVMKENFLKNNKKSSYANLLRTCGYGVPNLDKALGILKNNVNLIVQSEIAPYKLKNDHVIYNEFHIYEIPWPKEVLLGLNEKKFKVKVTLSYFIEPNPGNFREIYDYQSYGLRFEFSGNRTRDELIKKISKVDGKNYTDNNSDKWTYGAVARNVGSVHSDIWEGSGADFIDNNYIVIYPVGGWWKQQKKKEKYKEKVKYSLIVSISSDEENIDLFTPIYNEVSNLIKNENMIKIK